MNERMNEWLNDWMTAWLNDWLTDWRTDWLNRWTNEPRTIESMNQWILSTSSSKSAPISWFFLHCWSANKNSAPSRAHFANFIFQKCSDPLRFLAILKCKSSFRYSHVLIWPTSSSKTALNARVFLTCWSANRALATVLCTFCRQLSLIAASNKRNIDPTSATHGATSLKKTQGFSPDNVFTREFTRSRTVNYFSTALTCKLLFLTILSTWRKDFPCIFIHNSEVFELNFLWP